jgi:DNA-binding HxlR family transcriptional regulator
MDEKQVLNNLQFDRMFLDKVATVKTRKPQLYWNGVPYHYVLVFKILCLIKDAELSTNRIRSAYRDLFGGGINQSSLSRTLKSLTEDLRIISYVENPHGDVRLTWVRLTQEGKKLQKHFIGSTSVGTPYGAEVKQLIVGRR